MTVSTTDRVANFVADGIILTFNFNFKVVSATDIKVYEDDVLTSLGHSIPINPDQETSPGGSVVFNPTAPGAGVKLTIRREIPLTQGVDYTPYDAFPAETHEGALDRLTMQVQEVSEVVDRSVQAPGSDDGSTDFTLPAYDAGKGLMWDPISSLLKNSIDNFDTIVSDATAQAVIATAQAVASAASAAASEAAYDSFDDRYLGAKASDPTVDNDGDPLIVGALYWNSTANNMRAWSGSAWAVVGGTGDHLGVSDTATGVVFNISDTIAYFTTKLGVGADHDLGVGLHVKTSDVAGASIFSSADQVVIEANTSGGITIVSNDATTGYVVFADGSSSFECGIAYAHGTSEFSITTAGFTKRLTMLLGMYMGAATSGDMGVGAGNFEGLYINGVAVPLTETGTYTYVAVAASATPNIILPHSLGTDNVYVACTMTGSLSQDIFSGWVRPDNGGGQLFGVGYSGAGGSITTSTTTGNIRFRTNNNYTLTQDITMDYIITSLD